MKSDRELLELAAKAYGFGGAGLKQVVLYGIILAGAILLSCGTHSQTTVMRCGWR